MRLLGKATRVRTLSAAWREGHRAANLAGPQPARPPWGAAAAETAKARPSRQTNSPPWIAACGSANTRVSGHRVPGCLRPGSRSGIVCIASQRSSLQLANALEELLALNDHRGNGIHTQEPQDRHAGCANQGSVARTDGSLDLCSLGVMRAASRLQQHAHAYSLRPCLPHARKPSASVLVQVSDAGSGHPVLPILRQRMLLRRVGHEQWVSGATALGDLRQLRLENVDAVALRG